MDPQIQKRIDKALSQVLEPQSNVPIVDLGLVEKVTYSEKEKTIILTLAIGTPRFECPACSAINGVVKEGVIRKAQEAFTAEFPEMTVIVQ